MAWILAVLVRTTNSPPQRVSKNLGVMHVVIHTERNGTVQVKVVQSMNNRKYYIKSNRNCWLLGPEDFRRLVRIEGGNEKGKGAR